jgi:hypothetical protein
MPGGMAVIYKDHIASDKRNQQVTADVATAVSQGRNCLPGRITPLQAWETTPKAEPTRPRGDLIRPVG